MRIETNTLHIELSPAQREYARQRLWAATRRDAGRLAWAGMWLSEAPTAGVACRATAWVHGIGPVSVAQTAGDGFAAIDLAAARLDQALGRATRDAAMRRRAFAPVRAALRRRPSRASRGGHPPRRRDRRRGPGAKLATAPGAR